MNNTITLNDLATQANLPTREVAGDLGVLYGMKAQNLTPDSDIPVTFADAYLAEGKDRVRNHNAGNH